MLGSQPPSCPAIFQQSNRRRRPWKWRMTRSRFTSTALAFHVFSLAMSTPPKFNTIRPFQYHPMTYKWLGSPPFTLPETNIAPEKWWLEDDPFLLGFGLFSGAMLNFGRVSCLVANQPSPGEGEISERLMSIKSCEFFVLRGIGGRSPEVDGFLKRILLCFVERQKPSWLH